MAEMSPYTCIYSLSTSHCVWHLLNDSKYLLNEQKAVSWELNECLPHLSTPHRV